MTIFLFICSLIVSIFCANLSRLSFRGFSKLRSEGCQRKLHSTWHQAGDPLSIRIFWKCVWSSLNLESFFFELRRFLLSRSKARDAKLRPSASFVVFCSTGGDNVDLRSSVYTIYICTVVALVLSICISSSHDLAIFLPRRLHSVYTIHNPWGSFYLCTTTTTVIKRVVMKSES